MQAKKMITLAVAILFCLAAVSGSVLAKEQTSTLANPSAAKTMELTVVGKIVKDESMGGYYIQGKKPPEIFRILNQNPKVLEQYAKSGEDVTILAVSVIGDNVNIEEIDGKKYTEADK